MGHNTSMLILNDALNSIKNDKEFGRKVHEAVCELSSGRGQIDISSGGHCNAATVVETHHADATSVVAFQGNLATVLAEHIYAYGDEPEEIRILKQLADKYGYSLRKKYQPRK